MDDEGSILLHLKRVQTQLFHPAGQCIGHCVLDSQAVLSLSAEFKVHRASMRTCKRGLDS